MPVVIENPIINSPFAEPSQHYAFDEENKITGNIVSGRRPSSYFVPIASPKKQSKQLTFDSLLTPEKREESGHINRIRAEVNKWRALGWPDTTNTTKLLLEPWNDPTRSRKLFFCQLEALETMIFITECAKQSTYGQGWIEEYLNKKAEEAGTKLFRMACKMATGSGKTVVMAMLIAWQTINKRRTPRDKRFSDSFLIVAPGITIKDRLRVLLPSDPNNYYRELDIVPPELRGFLGTAKIVITNFHAFKCRENSDAGGLTKRVLNSKKTGAFTESPDQMVSRVCRELGNLREVLSEQSRQIDSQGKANGRRITRGQGPR